MLLLLEHSYELSIEVQPRSSSVSGFAAMRNSIRNKSNEAYLSAKAKIEYLKIWLFFFFFSFALIRKSSFCVSSILTGVNVAHLQELA